MTYLLLALFIDKIIWHNLQNDYPEESKDFYLQGTYALWWLYTPLYTNLIFFSLLTLH